ncbi:MAG TPA: serine protease [Pirellulaceae bacterium]|nr:serine protease [Pirellulaceae bacterium]
MTLMPMGGQVGTSVEVKVAGERLEGATSLEFSHPGIVATPKLDPDGKPVPNEYSVAIGSDVPVGIYEARVATPFGLSSSRIFSVGNLPESTQSQPSTTAETATELAVGSVCNATAPVRAANYFRFAAEKDQRISVDCAAAGIDSKLSPVVIVGDAAGRDLAVERRGDVLVFTAPEQGDYNVKVHDLTFKGGPERFFRIALRELTTDQPPARQPGTYAVKAFSWPPTGLAPEAAVAETEPNDGEPEVQTISLPCDLSGTFFPAADVDVFEFVAKKGETWWVEVASERLGLPTDPSILVQRVIGGSAETGATETLVDVTELTDIPSPVKVSSNGYAYDGPPYDAGSSDILGKIDVPEDGRYRLQLLDLFGGTRTDARNRFRLVIRKATPDFAVVAWALHMELRNGDRNALSKPISLRPGATMALEAVAIRRDGFDGPIDLTLENLPPRVTATGLRIAPGKSRGILLITADANAPEGRSSAELVARASIDGQEVTRTGRLASMAWPVQDAWSEIPSPRLLLDVAVSVGSVEGAPLTIEPKVDGPLEVEAGTKLTIPLAHVRRSEFSGAALQMKTMGDGFEGNPAFELPLGADASETVLDLAALNVPPGDYVIAFYGGAVAKYVPPTVGAPTGDAAPSSPAAKDIVDIVVSKPIAIRVKPPVSP